MADRIRASLTPILLAILLTLIAVAVLDPIGKPPDTGIGDPFYMAFTES